MSRSLGYRLWRRIVLLRMLAGVLPPFPPRALLPGAAALAVYLAAPL